MGWGGGGFVNSERLLIYIGPLKERFDFPPPLLLSIKKGSFPGPPPLEKLFFFSNNKGGFVFLPPLRAKVSLFGPP